MAGKEGITERKVAVITGASSGIGMATALEFAENDYNVVLAARRMDELQNVASMCEEYGVEALVVATDVSDDEQVQNLALRAVDAMGHIDVWINDAGVYAVGPFEDIPLEDMRRVMDVNFFGVVHGSYVALAQFRNQGYGTLINVSSVNAGAPQPYVGIYSASKAAVRALGEAIRMELKIEGLDKNIRVTTVMPAAIDTNIFQNSANYSGRTIQALEPVYDPEYVAKNILKVTKTAKREKYIGPAGAIMALQRTHLPANYENQISKFVAVDLLGEEAAADTKGNLYESIDENRGIHGGWRDTRMRADKFNLAVGTTVAAIVGLLGIGLFVAKKVRS